MTARYDRLAPLNAPERERTFPGWAVLRDLDGAERDGDSARRARLRFLALRPAYRLIARGFGAVPLESVERQIDRVREELGQLPARDPERAALAALLNDLRSRDPEVVISAILSVSEFAEANGFLAAANEYARVALDLARKSDRDPLARIATRGLARVALSAGQLEEAAARAQEARDLAHAADDRGEWIEAVGQLAAFHRRAGEASQARDALLVALKRAREWGNEAWVGLALAQLCRDAAESGQPEAVIEFGWPALRSLERTNDRALVLSLLGDALNTLGLSKAADRCFALVTLRASTPALRVAGLAGSALAAAQSADRDRYRERRAAALRELAPANRFARASAHVELGRAAWLVDDSLSAREHLREAFVLLRDHPAAQIRARAEELLHALEQETSAQLLRRSDAGVPDQTRRIAAELEHMSDLMVTAE